MVERKVSYPWLLIISGLYFGGLFYWIQDDLLNATGEVQTRALQMYVTAIIYVLYVVWGTISDLPERLREMPYGKATKPTIWFLFVLALAWWGWVDTATVGFLLVGVALLGFGAGLGISVSLYTGSESSRLYALSRLVDVYPSITKPEGHVRFNQKLWTTTLVLIIYFMMTNVMIYGLSDSTLDIFSSFRSIMAGASGSIMHLGIGPIVTGSIIMQLFAGAKIIQLDLQDSADKQLYQGIQKLLVLFMIPVESIPQVYGFLDPHETMIYDYGVGWANVVIVSQLFLGSYLVFLLDELVSKWGIGSGISLFIAAGVAQSTFVGTLSPLPVSQDFPMSLDLSLIHI